MSNEPHQTLHPEDTMNGAGSGNMDEYDPTFTKRIIAAMGPKTSPRLRQVMTSLITHVHDFAREVDLTVDEWMAGVDMINKSGQLSTDVRNDGQLLCDVIGLESLVDEITYKLAADSTDTHTQSAILGPFFRHDHPIRKNGESIVLNPPADGQTAYMHGRVLDSRTGKPLANAEIDLWEASTNGLYEQQDPDQTEQNLRGKFITDEDGNYATYVLRPTPYPIPDDSPAYQLLEMMDRNVYRPAHIHILAAHEGYKPIVTQIFDADSKHLEDDSVFAVKDSLLVKFEPRKNDKQAEWELYYDILLKPVS